MTRDNRIVCFHDDNLQRLCNVYNSSSMQSIEEMDLVEIQKIKMRKKIIVNNKKIYNIYDKERNILIFDDLISFLNNISIPFILDIEFKTELYSLEKKYIKQN